MTHVLQAESRGEMTRGELKTLRTSRKVPAVVYGSEVQPFTVVVDANPFEKVYKQAGASSLIDLDVAGTKHTVLVKDVQTDPVTGAFSHIDFFAVSMKKELEADVTLEFVGESQAVKNMGGTLMKLKDKLTVRCLPKDLVRSIEVSIEKLAGFDDVITVGDIQAPAGITFNDAADEVVAKVSAPLTEEQMKALEAENAADVSKVEVIGEKEEAAEGEAGESKE